MDPDTFTQLLVAGGGVVTIVTLILKFFSLFMGIDQ